MGEIVIKVTPPMADTSSEIADEILAKANLRRALEAIYGPDYPSLLGDDGLSREDEANGPS